ncbi:mechanosensitive ion channel family protein [Sphingosinicella terrae]|uniref:mechanosensitive ion channel family protein n=1 Tax=Sphingosinicella terrae TaxID=2172047 RepID=UPI00254799FD|nr:mechanosensitive ion channel domain-containing protein [Sphingosinicella terrae]
MIEAARLADPLVQALVAAGLLVAAALIGNWIAKEVLLRALRMALARTNGDFERESFLRIVRRLANLVPATIVQIGIAAVPHLPTTLVALVRNVTTGFMILTLALAIGAALDWANALYVRRASSISRPIKGYLQVLKIAVFSAAVILVVAVLADRSPLLLLSGLGAMAAVLMLVFKDTILSLVASVQLSSNDMVRLGDWIEMPDFGADGDVVDIALHTVKVQNWDKTITTIPTHRLISEPFRNWRGMVESGGRRIKRALTIDQNSIRFLEPQEIDRLRRLSLLAPYLEAKEAELASWHAARPGLERDRVNARRLTNIGTFRAYVSAYLAWRDDISKTMFMLVRQLPAGPSGLPVEIYAFAASTDWAEYERIQADVFDHLIAILPEFRLRLFQQPTGLDLSGAFASEDGPHLRRIAG